MKSTVGIQNEKRNSPFIEKLHTKLPEYLCLYLLTAGFDSEEAVKRISFDDPQDKFHISKIEQFVENYISSIEEKDRLCYYAKSDYLNITAKIFKILPGHLVQLELFQNSLKNSDIIEKSDNLVQLEENHLSPRNTSISVHQSLKRHLDTSVDVIDNVDLPETIESVKRKRVRRRSKKRTVELADISAKEKMMECKREADAIKISDNHEQQSVRPISRVKFSDDGEIESVAYMDEYELESLNKNHNRKQMKKSGKFAMGSIKTSWDKLDTDYKESISNCPNGDNHEETKETINTMQEDSLDDVDLDKDNNYDENREITKEASTLPLLNLTDYSNYKDFTGQPSVGMKIAFKMIVLNEEKFQPETSSYIVGFICDMDDKTKRCSIKVIESPSTTAFIVDENILIHWSSLIDTKCLGSVDIASENHQDILTKQ